MLSRVSILVKAIFNSFNLSLNVLQKCMLYRNSMLFSCSVKNSSFRISNYYCYSFLLLPVGNINKVIYFTLYSFLSISFKSNIQLSAGRGRLNDPCILKSFRFNFSNFQQQHYHHWHTYRDDESKMGVWMATREAFIVPSSNPPSTL